MTGRAQAFVVLPPLVGLPLYLWRPEPVGWSVVAIVYVVAFLAGYLHAWADGLQAKIETDEERGGA